MIIKCLGLTDYSDTYLKMKEFTDNRSNETIDELWVTQHYPVFTQGIAGKEAHILQKTDVPIIKTDRGGQITFHGEGQLIFYPLLNLKRSHLSAKKLINLLEITTTKTLASFNIKSYSKATAPGIYVFHENEEKKISSLGLKIRKGFSYHGLSLNVNMDLSPFLTINPCGYHGLKMINICDLNETIDIHMVESVFVKTFQICFKKFVMDVEGSVHND